MLLTRGELEQMEAEKLAPYAMKSSQTSGRVFKEPKDPYRLPFQRDRARIVNSRSFRRLQAKTQVFVSKFGDHYRDRMTHTIEVAQIAGDTSRALGLNEDLAECIALAHDLGHTPFGHGGEEALNEIMQKYDSKFEHNEQSRRIVESLERIYPGFDGLNLSKEVLDGLLKHNPHHYDTHSEFITSPHLEAQVADISDEVAYTNHDVDDGLRSGIINIDQLKQFQIWKDAEKAAAETYGSTNIDQEGTGKRRYYSRVISKMISAMIRDLQTNTDRIITENNIDSLERVRLYKGKIVSMSTQMRSEFMELRKFLFENLYYHPDVESQIERGKQIIRELFSYYMDNPDQIPGKYFGKNKIDDKPYIVVKDYIAGMTDNFAEDQWKKTSSN